jgi:hypothetical protein
VRPFILSHPLLSLEPESSRKDETLGIRFFVLNVRAYRVSWVIQTKDGDPDCSSYWYTVVWTSSSNTERNDSTDINSVLFDSHMMVSCWCDSRIALRALSLNSASLFDRGILVQTEVFVIRTFPNSTTAIIHPIVYNALSIN